MAQHIVLMSVVAPGLVLILRAQLSPRFDRFLVPATVVQIGILWFWHAPFSLPHAMNAQVAHAVMQATLLGSALWFWAAVVSAVGTGAWRPIAALLITSKLFCLLGVLLTFAPRALYTPHGVPAAIDDQQLAGLLMLIACPATYLLAAVILAARWLDAIEATPAGGNALG